MVPTAQKRQPRVHSSPATMKVAVPLPQQSCMFGQRASSQTVCSPPPSIVFFVALNLACSSPVGRLVLNHGGRRLRRDLRFSFAVIEVTPPPQPPMMGSTASAIGRRVGPMESSLHPYPINRSEWTYGYIGTLKPMSDSVDVWIREASLSLVVQDALVA